jgi:hypothetical protein
VTLVEDFGFEVLASSLRADTRDIKGFMEALATKLEGALPSQTMVERKGGGMFSREKRVTGIVVNMGDQQYQLNTQSGRIEPRVCKVVRGIVLKTEEVPLDAWIDQLSQVLTEEAQRSEGARLALERLLGV